MFYPELLVGKWIARAAEESFFKVTGFVGGEDDCFTIKTTDDITQLLSFNKLRTWSFFETDKAAALHAGSKKNVS